jgi:hypothetical protein
MKTMRTIMGIGLALLILAGWALAQAPLEKPLAEFERLVSQLTVGSVVGEPIEVGKTTVIPFARVSFSLGAGGMAMGLGGGMGTMTAPLGVLIVEGDDVRAELFQEAPPKPSFFDQLRKLMADKLVIGNGINIAGSPGAFEELLPTLPDLLKGMRIIGNGINVAGVKATAPAAPSPAAPPAAGSAKAPAGKAATPAAKAAATAQPAPPGPPPSMSELQKLYQAKKFPEAVAMADALLAKDPNNAELHALKGDALGSQAASNPIKYGMAAMQEYETALSLDPTNVHALIGRAIGRLMAPPGFGGDVDGAIKDLETANAKSPSAVAYYYLGQAFQRKMLNEKAKSAYEEALRLRPEYPEAKKALEALK